MKDERNMGNGIKVCKVCGKEYKACAPAYNTGDMYRWQDVACCQEHGMEYFRLIAEARADAGAVKQPEVEQKTANNKVRRKNVSVGTDKNKADDEPKETK